MRSADALTAALLALAQACAVPLDDPIAAAPTPDAPPRLVGCPLLAAPPAVLGAVGRVQAVMSTDGAATVVADALQYADGTRSPGAAAIHLAPAHTPPGACGGGWSPPLGAELRTLGLGSLDEAVTINALAAFDSPTGLRAFVRTSLGEDAVGTALAAVDPASGDLVAAPPYLFTADRPVYGEAVLVSDDHLYAYGCAPSGWLEDACFVARVPMARVSEPSAWRFSAGGGTWVDDPDLAWPSFSGGRGLAVRRDGERVLVAYATPLSTTLMGRSGLGPDGPWSAPTPLGSCATPAGAFCGPLAFLPALDGEEGLAIAQGVASFEALTPEEQLTRLVRVPRAAFTPRR